METAMKTTLASALILCLFLPGVSLARDISDLYELAYATEYDFQEAVKRMTDETIGGSGKVTNMTKRPLNNEWEIQVLCLGEKSSAFVTIPISSMNTPIFKANDEVRFHGKLKDVKRRAIVNPPQLYFKVLLSSGEIY